MLVISAMAATRTAGEESYAESRMSFIHAKILQNSLASCRMGGGREELGAGKEWYTVPAISSQYSTEL
jgi:hypothetical protein